MESTGVYWIPLYELLEHRGFEVILSEPSQIKKVPGRKSDVLDCQWIQRLHSFGLLRGSFRPDDAIVVLRAYLRQRETLVGYAASHVQHMQKALEQMNVKLTEVISDITGLTGMSIIEAILAGQRDPETLAKLRHERCKNDEATIALALQGNWREEHLFALRQSLQLYCVYHEKLLELDAQIESYLQTFADRSKDQAINRPLKKPRRRRDEPAFDSHGLLFRMTGVDLTTVDGIGSHSALQLISEIGSDMNCWETEKQFCSWLSLCPGVNKTGGRKRSRSGRTRPSANRAARVLRLCAQSLFRADCALGAFGRRMRARLGAPKAVTAVAHKLAKIVYGMLKYGKPYIDQGACYYQERYHQQLVNNLRRRAGQLGYSLAPSTQ
jgi:transposase